MWCRTGCDCVKALATKKGLGGPAGRIGSRSARGVRNRGYAARSESWAWTEA